MLELTFKTGDPVTAPELRIHRRESDDAVIIVDDHVGKTWGCSPSRVKIGAVMRIENWGEGCSDGWDTNMRVVAPAKKRELTKRLRRLGIAPLLARGFWYEVIAD